MARLSDRGIFIMTIPTTLKIGAHQIQVLIVEHFDDCGEFDPKTNIIKISKELPDTQKLQTLIHEVLHALNGELEHALLDSLSAQLAAVITDNGL